MPRFEGVVQPDEAGTRADVWLCTRCELTRSRVAALISQGRATAGGKTVGKPGFSLSAGQLVAIEWPDAAPSELVPEDIPLEILYEDTDLIVINKPAGLVVHPSAGHLTGTLAHALLHHCGDLSGIGGQMRPGIVHRLDKDTSGALAVAKNDAMHRAVSDLLKARDVLREYVAVVVGLPKQEGGVINAPIARHTTDRKRMAIVAGGREAITEWSVLERFPSRTLSFVACRLHTGRTHQIRVHMASIHHPVLADPMYAPKSPHSHLRSPLIRRQALHARTLGFVHPFTGEEMLFEAPLPMDMSALLKGLRE